MLMQSPLEVLIMATQILCVKADEEAYYLTSGKAYDVEIVYENGSGVIIYDDEGDQLFIWLSRQSAHGDFKLMDGATS